MAVFNDKSRKLVIVLNGGTTANGGRKTKRLTIAGLSEEADATAVSKAANHVADLIENEVLDFEVYDVNGVAETEDNLGA